MAGNGNADKTCKVLLYLLHLHIFSLEIKIKMSKIYTVLQFSLQMFNATLLNFMWSKAEKLKFSRCHMWTIFFRLNKIKKATWSLSGIHTQKSICKYHGIEK